MLVINFIICRLNLFRIVWYGFELFFSASPSINQSYTVCAKDKMIVDVVFWIIIFHLNTFSVKWLEARIYEKEARPLFDHERNGFADFT